MIFSLKYMAGWTTEFHKFHFKYSNDYDSLWDNVNGYDELISDSFFISRKFLKIPFLFLILFRYLVDVSWEKAHKWNIIGFYYFVNKFTFLWENTVCVQIRAKHLLIIYGNGTLGQFKNHVTLYFRFFTPLIADF